MLLPKRFVFLAQDGGGDLQFQDLIGSFVNSANADIVLASDPALAPSYIYLVTAGGAGSGIPINLAKFTKFTQPMTKMITAIAINIYIV